MAKVRVGPPGFAPGGFPPGLEKPFPPRKKSEPRDEKEGAPSVKPRAKESTEGRSNLPAPILADPKRKEASDPAVPDIKGKIRRVGADDPTVVELDVGGDHGLKQGQTLEVYRLEPRPQYVGTVRVSEVQPRQAVAHLTRGQPGAFIRVGDLVAARLVMP
jgi:hypothetical protein